MLQIKSLGRSCEIIFKVISEWRRHDLKPKSHETCYNIPCKFKSFYMERNPYIQKLEIRLGKHSNM